MPDLIDDLTHDVAGKLRLLGFSTPSVPVLAYLFRTCYLASLKTEEGRFVRGSITYADPRKPELTAPFRRRADYPAFTAFARTKKPLAVESLVKLSRAIDKWSGSIAVHGTNASNVVIWGVLDQLVQHNVRINRESDSGFDAPGIITINMDGVGDISAYSGSLFLAGLSGQKLVVRENDSLRSPALAARVKPALVPVADAIARALGVPESVEDHLADLWKEWSNTISRLCIGLRRLGTGGSLLITPSPKMTRLNVLYKFDYRRLGDAVRLKVLDDAYALNTSFAFRDFDSNEVPKDVVWEMEFAQTDAEDRESEVTGAVKIVTSLAAVDGLVLLSPDLRVSGFGVKIGATPGVRTVYDGADFARRETRARKIDPSRFGTRHTSMLRYCRLDREAVGIVVSQDGHVRVIMSVGGSVTLWDNVKLLGHGNFSTKVARNKERWRKQHERAKPNDASVELGYTPTPKTIAQLLAQRQKK